MAKITFGSANGRKLNKHDVSIFSCGTLPVNGRVVSGCLPLTRGDKVNINYAQESILAPLVAPTFGSFNLKTMAFFVPAHTIWRGYRSWVSGSVDTSTPNAPLNFSLEDLAFLITGSASPATNAQWNGNFVDEPNDLSGSYLNLADLHLQTNGFDFVCFDSNTFAFHAANFTAKGRELWSTLTTLGYNFPSRIDCDQVDYFTKLNYSIFPFMAFARCCYDWLYPSAYVNQQGFSFLFETPLNNSWSNQVTRQSLILKMADCWFNQYDQDFYTSLWSKPNQVGSGSGSASNVVRDDTFSNGDLKVRSLDTESDVLVSQSNSSYSLTLSAQSLRWLTSISDFVLRNNIGGARFREFMKSHFGYNTSNDTCDESIFLKLWSDTIHIGKVANQSSGVDMGALGELAGLGSGNGTGSLKFKADEAGFLIFVSEIKPNVGYYQGNRPWARALTDRFQLYTPEFDGVGMEGVPRQAVFEAYDNVGETNIVGKSSLNDAFGFAPRYSERYKIGHDNLFGDFRLASRNKQLSAWHTFRNVLYGRSNLALDAQFLSVDNQYQRIFRYIGAQSDGVNYDVDDKVWVKLNFQIDKYSTAKSLGNSLPFFEENGQEVHTNYLGSDVK